MRALRVSLKPEVERFSEVLERDLVKLWGYADLDGESAHHANRVLRPSEMSSARPTQATLSAVVLAAQTRAGRRRSRNCGA